MNDDVLMTLKEVAKYLKISVHTIYKMVEYGRMPATRLGRQLRFRKSDVYKWLADKMTREKKARYEKWQKKYKKLMKEKP